MPPKKTEKTQKQEKAKQKKIDEQSASEEEVSDNDDNISSKTSNEDEQLDENDYEPEEKDDLSQPEIEGEDENEENDQDDLKSVTETQPDQSVQCYLKYAQKQQLNASGQYKLMPMKVANKNEHITFNRLTKYEVVNLLSTRHTQLVNRASTTLKNYQHFTPYMQCRLELYIGIIPLTIQRPMPDKTIEIIDPNELVNGKRKYKFKIESLPESVIIQYLALLD